jgi:hypothetical protein
MARLSPLSTDKLISSRMINAPSAVLTDLETLETLIIDKYPIEKQTY